MKNTRNFSGPWTVQVVATIWNQNNDRKKDLDDLENMRIKNVVFTFYNVFEKIDFPNFLFRTVHRELFNRSKTFYAV